MLRMIRNGVILVVIGTALVFGIVKWSEWASSNDACDSGYEGGQVCSEGLTKSRAEMDAVCWKIEYDPRGEGNAETYYTDRAPEFSGSFVTLHSYWFDYGYHEWHNRPEITLVATDDLKITKQCDGEA